MTDTATLFSELICALAEASKYNSADVVPPVAVLWTDPERQWAPLLPRLRGELPILTLGSYDPQTLTGPAIWLRCVVARVLPDAAFPPEGVPIVYLPGVSRATLRAVNECPAELQPLAELQFRGTLWLARNERDWTIAGFLREVLHVDAAADAATVDGLNRSIERLTDEPVAALRLESPLTAAKLNALLNPEPVRNLLLWMSGSEVFKASQTDAEWNAFRDTCRHDYKFDPVKDGNLTAAQKLGEREGSWDAVWSRFAEAPARYPNLPSLLRRGRPASPHGLLHLPSSWPQDNDAEEAALRARLLALKDVMSDDARKQIVQLEQAHGLRRGWVWAELGLSPLASALSALLALAESTATALGGSTPGDVAKAYTSAGWRADAAALDALAVTGGQEDVAAIQCAVDVLYRSWLRDSAEAFQRSVANHPLRATPAAEAVAPAPGRCWLFADGLRYDVAQKLADTLEQAGLLVARDWQWAALPTVTATAKPAVSPVAHMLGPGSDLNCVVVSDGATVTAEILRRELIRAGYDILATDETGNAERSAWTECGSIDSQGHSRGCKLAPRLPEELRDIASRVRFLLDSGWPEVRIVTDHGWLLLPSNLPKVDLPEHLTEFRKGRCARMKVSSATDQQTVPWRWDRDVLIAVPPGIGCYVAKHEYDHGGLSPQECVVPVLTVRSAAPAGPSASIASVRWAGLRCRVQVVGGGGDMTVDLRMKAADASSTLTKAPKSVDAAGRSSVVVEEDSHLDHAAVVVLLAADGSVLVQQAVIVGRDS